MIASFADIDKFADNLKFFPIWTTNSIFMGFPNEMRS